MKAIKTCPFCGCERVVIDHEDDRQYYYHCPECEYDFSDEDAEHEQLRQQVSAYCSREMATEDNPIVCDGENQIDIPVVVLVNQYSASASEILLFIFIRQDASKNQLL